MTTDLWMLVATGLWGATIPLIYAAGRFTAPGGIVWAFGNRDAALAGVPAWAERAVRAHANTIENLALFAILVLCAHVAGKANDATALGAQVFFVGRVLHTLLYTAGAIYLRTAAFFLAVGGEILILLQLFK
ncbi:MAG TPA: MAPEG family protein [Verrucomicrobiae bacterium]|nr:MAPEG family protein [Verrucomicrobiae bacterium]